MKVKTKNKLAITLGLLGIVTIFYIFPVILHVIGLVLSIQIMKTTNKQQGKIALAINIAGILVAISIVMFLSQLNFTPVEFGILF